MPVIFDLSCPKDSDRTLQQPEITRGVENYPEMAGEKPSGDMLIACQVDVYECPIFRRGLNLDASSVLSGDLRRDGEPQTASTCGTCSRCICAVETLGKMTNCLRRDVPAFIMHGYPNALIGTTLRPEGHGPAGRTVPDSIVDHIGQQA